MPRCHLLLFAWLASLLLTTASHGLVSDDLAADSPSPFKLAIYAPNDLTMFVQIDDAAQLRRTLAERPIARWIDAVLSDGQANLAWLALSDEAGIDANTLFDTCFGTSITIMLRTNGDQSQWVLITQMDATASNALLTKLNAIVRGPRMNMAMMELPEHELVLAKPNRKSPLGERVLIIGPKAQQGLFEQVLQRIDAPGQASLAQHPAIERAARLGNGSIGLYLKHDAPMGGWSVVVGDVRQHELFMRHHASFDHAPFTRSVSTMRIDPTPLRGFEQSALLAMIEPTDVGGGSLETFLQAGFEIDLLGAQMRRNVSQRRIVVVGEIEGRQEPHPVDIQATTVALCTELKNAAVAQRQFDRQMVNVAHRLHALGNGRFEIEVPCHRSFEPGQPRSIDISPAAQWLAGTLPLARPITLNWAVVASTGDDADRHASGWAIIATHPQQLADTVQALQASDGDESAQRRVQSSGFANGSRIGQHLRSWSDRAELFAAPAQMDEFKNSLLMMSKLASGIERVQWRMTRPDANTMCLDLSISLLPPESASDGETSRDDHDR